MILNGILLVVFMHIPQVFHMLFAGILTVVVLGDRMDFMAGLYFTEPFVNLGHWQGGYPGARQSAAPGG